MEGRVVCELGSRLSECGLLSDSLVLNQFGQCGDV